MRTNAYVDSVLIRDLVLHRPLEVWITTPKADLEPPPDHKSSEKGLVSSELAQDYRASGASTGDVVNSISERLHKRCFSRSS